MRSVLRFDQRFEETHFRRADEARDEAVHRRIVDLGRRADLFDHAVAQHDDAVGQRHRLGLVVRDIDHGGAEARGAAWRVRAASARAARRRDSTAARRTGTLRARARWRGRSPPAGAGRRTAPSAGGPADGSSCSVSATAATRLSRSAFGMPCISSEKAMFSATVLCG